MSASLKALMETNCYKFKLVVSVWVLRHLQQMLLVVDCNLWSLSLKEKFLKQYILFSFNVYGGQNPSGCHCDACFGGSCTVWRSGLCFLRQHIAFIWKIKVSVLLRKASVLVRIVCFPKIKSDFFEKSFCFHEKVVPFLFQEKFVFLQEK